MRPVCDEPRVILNNYGKEIQSGNARGKVDELI